ncbi:MAG: 5'-methylthioadenosine/adenosylhomocysteine nucleosidase [Prevotellaceae bacterium]|jgi:adenosylhomocysteine nucleosidase|nr:5'-methylthioadenosine/adenosylhomocysteine nucleosidase [Prevotellaceae bacterium]
MRQKTIGVMGAMPEEVNGIIQLLTDSEEVRLGMRTYYTGQLNGVPIVVVFSRWGKVAAATTVSTLILHFNVSEIIFTGVAGAIDSGLNAGDIVIGKRLIQHDLDGRPLMKQFEIPLLGVQYLEAPPEALERAVKAVHTLLDGNHLFSAVGEKELRTFGIVKPKVVAGDIASGDQFFASSKAKEELLQKLPGVLCVEMEGAAVAQVCYEYGISFTVLRTVSDTADEQSHIDFPAFIEKISNKYSIEIVKNILQCL